MKKSKGVGSFAKFLAKWVKLEFEYALTYRDKLNKLFKGLDVHKNENEGTPIVVKFNYGKARK